MKILNALTAGLAGAVALTVTHQLLQKLFDDAPRMDLMGEEALSKISNKAEVAIPEKKLYNLTLAGDIIVNSLYYALVTAGKNKKAQSRGTLLGLAAGISGVYLPKYLGLTNAYSNRRPATKLMTVAIYSLGGYVSAKVGKALEKN